MVSKFEIGDRVNLKKVHLVITGIKSYVKNEVCYEVRIMAPDIDNHGYECEFMLGAITITEEYLEKVGIEMF